VSVSKQRPATRDGSTTPPPAKPARWPVLLIAVGGVLTVLWIALLGWGAFKLAEMVVLF
jgi:hypothetical protein